MGNIDFTIEENDLKCLYIACGLNQSFDRFKEDCKKGYTDYRNRNLADLKKYGTPKTFSQWVNGQILALA